mmetsp:Transcript_5136/g.7878  ORF Transcript_5136/g.7878 Transcript_5136/m.7878 type:complete len:132 (+) Transcript_5136:179-574(+)
MTTDFSKLIELSIVNEGITAIDNYNESLKKLGGTLRKLDLSMNFLTRCQNLDQLPNLRELNLSFNKLRKIENIGKLSLLKVLILDSNKLKSIHGVKGLRKLSKLSMVANRIENLVPSDSTEPMLELQELHL